MAAILAVRTHTPRGSGAGGRVLATARTLASILAQSDSVAGGPRRGRVPSQPHLRTVPPAARRSFSPTHASRPLVLAAPLAYSGEDF